jgi:hypothetical protein
MYVKYSLYLILGYLLGVLFIRTVSLCVSKLSKILTGRITHAFRKHFFVYATVTFKITNAETETFPQ